MNFKEFLDQKEEKQIDEDVGAVIGTALGVGIAATAIAFGGTLVVLAGSKAYKKLRGLWDTILGNLKSKHQPKEVIAKIANSPEVKEEKIKIEEKKREFADELKDVYAAIDSKNFDEAAKAFGATDRNTRNNPDVHRAIIVEITKANGEPPLYVRSPGNSSYQAIKKIINIRTAKAAASATESAIRNAAASEK